jgi:hypothetical protein
MLQWKSGEAECVRALENAVTAGQFDAAIDMLQGEDVSSAMDQFMQYVEHSQQYSPITLFILLQTMLVPQNLSTNCHGLTQSTNSCVGRTLSLCASLGTASFCLSQSIDHGGSLPPVT